MVTIQKNALRTFFLSDTQATDSTFSGCRPNNAATRALFQIFPGHSSKYQEEQKGIDHVEHQIGGMMHSRIHSGNLAVHHVGEPCDRVPVGIVFVFKAESPCDVFKVDTGPHMRISSDIHIVVKVYEFKISHLPVHGQHGKRQQQANEQFQANVEAGIRRFSSFRRGYRGLQSYGFSFDPHERDCGEHGQGIHPGCQHLFNLRQVLKEIRAASFARIRRRTTNSRTANGA
jgi:hypothetical protein